MPYDSTHMSQPSGWKVLTWPRIHNPSVGQCPLTNLKTDYVQSDSPSSIWTLPVVGYPECSNFPFKSKC